MFDEIINMIEKLKDTFQKFESECKGILLFGSYAKEKPTGRSDVDICVIKPAKELLNTLYEKFGGKFDIRMFEKLPLYIQIDIINHHIILVGDKLELSEYFYFFRKMWKDMEHRIKQNQFESFDDRMKYRRRWLNEKEKILREIRNV